MECEYERTALSQSNMVQLVPASVLTAAAARPPAPADEYPASQTSFESAALNPRLHQTVASGVTD
jgi:hypothetical protein